MGLALVHFQIYWLLSKANPFLEVYAIWLQTRCNSNPVNWVRLVVPKGASICYVMFLRSMRMLPNYTTTDFGDSKRYFLPLKLQ